MHIDSFLRTVFGRPLVTERENPASGIKSSSLTEQDKKHAAGLMRVNHTGEVCAQALYQGQSLTARNQAVREKLRRSSEEENDHLAWCEARLHELNSHPSYLNAVFYMGSLSLGVLAGLLGDKWNLGFLAETEHQVVKHLGEHLKKLPENDVKSRLIVQQMQADEAHHKDTAVDAGGAPLPESICRLMAMVADSMKFLAFRF
ncbi:MAG: demethoxyubiquinone hydroxylase family protein [Legionellaceae bacterium]|nr:demethoxyubiquinone hydroxylase family protein [Legionellaceae bacterium]